MRNPLLRLLRRHLPLKTTTIAILALGKAHFLLFLLPPQFAVRLPES